MAGRRMLKVGALTAVALVAGLAALVASSQNKMTTGGCVDDVDDTYEFHDNGMVLPGSTLTDPRIKDPDDYVSWTVPVRPQEGSDIVSVELARDDEWLTVTAELADRWIPYARLADPGTTWVPGDPLSGSTVTVLMVRDEWTGSVTIEDSAAETTFRVGESRSPGEDRRVIGLSKPVIAGNSASVRIPAEELDELGDSFQFSAWSSLVTSGDAAILDNCPNLEADHLKSPTVEFPNDVSSDEVSGSTGSRVEPKSSTAPPSTAAPATTHAVGVPPTSEGSPTTECEGVSGCLFDNGIDLGALRAELASALTQEGFPTAPTDVGCTTGPQISGPNRVRIGGSFECVVPPDVNGALTVFSVTVTGIGTYTWDYADV